MSLEALKKLIEDNKENKDIMDYVKGLNPITTDGVSSFLETEEGKKVLQPKLDGHFTKGLDTWKANNLSKILDEEINKRFPEESEEKKMLKKIQAELETEKNARVRESLKNKAITNLTGKGIPIEFSDFFLGNDDDSTTANLAKLESIWSTSLQKAVEEKFKENGRQPHNNPNPNQPDFSKMTDEEYYAYQQQNKK